MTGGGLGLQTNHTFDHLDDISFDTLCTGVRAAADRRRSIMPNRFPGQANATAQEDHPFKLGADAENIPGPAPIAAGGGVSTLEAPERNLGGGKAAAEGLLWNCGPA